VAELPRLDIENATTIYYTGNVSTGHYASATAIAPVKIAKKWDSQNTLQVYYNKLSLNSNNLELVNDQVSYMFQSSQTIQLPSDIKLELGLMYRGPFVSGLYKIEGMSRVDIGVKKSFMKKALELSINTNDLFKGMRYKFATDIGGNVNDFDQYLRFRNVGVTLRYNFSKGQKVENKRRTNTLEELNRT
jgi:hypothetical protein